MPKEQDELGCETDPEILNEVAEAVRAACIDVAVDAFEDASASGLCSEGAFECALGAIRMLDTSKFIRDVA